MKSGAIVLLLLLVACAQFDQGGQAGRGAQGLQPSSAPQQLVPQSPSRQITPVQEGPAQTLSVPGSRAGARGCVDSANQPCNRNQCGGTGIVGCNGVCTAPAPNVPGNLATACNRNACGGTGTVLCDGSCSAAAPTSPGALAQPCNRNQCGGSGVVQCDGSCNAAAPNVPSNFGQSCGCGGVIQCNGACTSSGCPSGTSCENNRCVAPPCTDTDGGRNPAVQGTTMGYVQTSYGKSSIPIGRTDSCASSNELKEYYCSYGYVGPGATEIYSIEGSFVCPCQNGRCV